MEIKTSIENCKALIRPAGMLTVSTSPNLSAVVEALPRAVRDIDVDLFGVTYVASAGLRVLMAPDRLAVKRGGRMRVLHPSNAVREVFEMTGLSEVFAIER